MPYISVIVCTHNGRPDYLRRVLEGLRAQTLPLQDWELLVIDNQSSEPLALTWDLSWHPRARHIREENLGLTHARLRGLKESTAAFLIYVDDDNVLAADYLESAIKLIEKKPWVAVWTAGYIEPEFEETPPAWLKRFFPYLALNENPREVWSNDMLSRLLPIGAGMVVRREVGCYYAKEIAGNPLRLSLERRGNQLLAAGDTDLGLCACEMGYACGQSPRLKVLHLISKHRVQPRYLIRLGISIVRSQRLLYLGRDLTQPHLQWITRKLIADIALFPIRCLTRGVGTALYSLSANWGEVLAILDFERFVKDERKKAGVKVFQEDITH